MLKLPDSEVFCGNSAVGDGEKWIFTPKKDYQGFCYAEGGP